MPNTFFLAANDAYDEHERRKGAYQVIKEWLGKPAWPVYRNTKNRLAFAPQDRVVIYAGGYKQHSQTIIGVAVIVKVRSPTKAELEELSQTSAPTPVKILDLGELVCCETPVSIRPILTRLEMFAGLGAKWGVALMGGSRKISEDDFALISSHIGHSSAAAADAANR